VKTIHFKLNQEMEFDQELIDDAPNQGRFDEYAEYLLSSFDVQVDLNESVKYLRSTGGWEDSELQDIELNKARLLWIALLDCKEQSTNYWYMGG
jgi:hypothetical protein